MASTAIFEQFVLFFRLLVLANMWMGIGRKWLKGKNKGRKVVGEGKIGDNGIILCNCTLKSEL